MTRIEIVYEALLPEMEANGIEDTPENRHDMLRGLLDAWNEDESPAGIEKIAYKFAVLLEMHHLRMKIKFPKYHHS